MFEKRGALGREGAGMEQSFVSLRKARSSSSVHRIYGRARSVAWWIPAVITVGLLCWLVWGALFRPWWALSSTTHWYQPGPNNFIFAMVFLGAWAVSFIAYWVPRKHKTWRQSVNGLPVVNFAVIVSLVVVTLTLGFASFVPCDVGLKFLSPGYRTVLLFIGDSSEGVIGPNASTACTGKLPLAMEIARFTGISATFIGALLVIMMFSRERLAKFVVTVARDVDLVVGLNRMSIPLILALLHEAGDRGGREQGWRHRRGTRRRTRVVVLHNNASDPLVAEVREAGGIVLFGNATESRVMRPILLNWNARGAARSASLRRLFVVTESQQVNMRVLGVADSLLQDVHIGPGDHVIPRLTVRLDNAREARDFRMRTVSTEHGFIDAISVDGLLADELLEVVRDARIETLCLQGDTELTVALLDQIAWHAWSTAQLVTHRTDEPSHDGKSGSALTRVLLLDERAAAILSEWEQHCPPAVQRYLPVIEARNTDWEERAEHALQHEASVALIVTDGDRGARSRANRLARKYPDASVFVHDATVRGVDTAGAVGIVKFGPCLHRNFHVGGGEVRRLVPEDGWTTIARFTHELYLAKSPPNSHNPARRRWGNSGDQSATRAPEFVREDNLRQLRELLSALERLGSGLHWAPYRAGTAAQLNADEKYRIAEGEHRRWVQFRIDNGWSGDVRSQEHGLTQGEFDMWAWAHKRNKNLRDWDSGAVLHRDGKWAADEPVLAPEALNGLRAWNIASVGDLLGTLEAWGVVIARDPRREPSSRYTRVGSVEARMLSEPYTWTTSTGDELSGDTGDWLVVSPDGGRRTVAAAEFPELYREVSPGRFERLGEVTARRVIEVETVHSIEGPATAMIGNWIVTDDRGNSWHMPDRVFQSGYEPVSKGNVGTR